MDAQVRDTPSGSTTVLVTGGAGFLGGHLLGALCQAQHQVIATRLPAEDPGPLAALPCQWQEAALPDRPPSLDGVGLVIHLAALEGGPPARVREVNVEGTRALLDRCEAAGARLIHVSSLDVALGREDTYGETKREAESLVRARSGLDWLILRPAVIYGARGGALLCKLIRRAAAGQPVPLPGRGEQLIQPLLVDDLAALLVRLVDQPLGQRVFEVGGPEAVSYRQLLSAAARTTGKQLTAVPVPVAPLMPWLMALERLHPGAPMTWSKLQSAVRSKTLDLGPIRHELGFEPTALDAGLERMLAGEGAL